MNKYLKALKQRNSSPAMGAKGAEDPFAPFAPIGGEPFLKFKASATVRSGAPISATSDTPITPYCVSVPADSVAAMLSELRDLIASLADAEGWTENHRVHVLNVLERQPIYSLAADLAYFQKRLNTVRGAEEAADAIARACAAHSEKYAAYIPKP